MVTVPVAALELALLVNLEALHSALHRVGLLIEHLGVGRVGSLRGRLLPWRLLGTEAVLKQDSSLALLGLGVLAHALLLLRLHRLGVLLVELVLVDLVEGRQRTLLLFLVRLTQHRVQLLRGRARSRQLLTRDERLLLVELTTTAEGGLLR